LTVAFSELRLVATGLQGALVRAVTVLPALGQYALDLAVRARDDVER
jgi:hypothetical protein